MKISILIILATQLIGFAVLGQKRVKLKQADALYGSVKDGERFDRVIGNVVFNQSTTTIYCDSAHFYKAQNRVEAFGRVHIVDGDSVDVTSRKLVYQGNERIALLRNDVVFTKKATATLYTDFLDYDRKKGQAKYFNDGKLVDSTNTLNSHKGYFDTQTNMASFKGDVVGVNPDYTMRSDTLQYDTKRKIIYFRDVTSIVDKDNQRAVYNSGSYNTVLQQSSLTQAKIDTPSQELTGKAYDINEKMKLYKVKGDVVMKSKEENMLVFGDEGFYAKDLGISKIYDHAYAAKVDDDLDTLFIAADTLISIDNEDPTLQRMLAYNNVRIYKSDLQGIADSLVYVNYDSMIYLYHDPVLWNTGNQMSADTIRIKLLNKTLHTIFLIDNSFVISQDSLEQFNQIKGRSMVAHFKNKELDHVEVNGNGESIYYALQENDPPPDDTTSVKTVTLTGVNKIICSNMDIRFKTGKIHNISFYVQPDATFIPPHEIKKEDTRLKNFNWRLEERPDRASIGSAVRKPEEEELELPKD